MQSILLHCLWKTSICLLPVRVNKTAVCIVLGGKVKQPTIKIIPGSSLQTDKLEWFEIWDQLNFRACQTLRVICFVIVLVLTTVRMVRKRKSGKKYISHVWMLQHGLLPNNDGLFSLCDSPVWARLPDTSEWALIRRREGRLLTSGWPQLWPGGSCLSREARTGSHPSEVWYPSPRSILWEKW